MIHFNSEPDFSDARFGKQREVVDVSQRLLEKLLPIVRQGHQSLLPNRLEQLRQQSRILPELPVPTHAQIDMARTIKAQLGRDEKSVFDGLISPFTIDQQHLPGGNTLLYVDKMRPHGKYDFMVTQGELTIRPRYEDLAADARLQIASNINTFMDFCSERNLTAVCSYSVDPETLDRKSAQSSKRFHVHFVGREKWETDAVKSQSIVLAELDSSYAQRRLVDETAVLLGFALADLIESGELASSFEVHRPFSQGSTFPFLRLYCDKPLENSHVERLANNFVALHGLYEELYGGLRSTLFAGNHGLWHRPRALPTSTTASICLDPRFSKFTSDLVLHSFGSFSQRILDVIELVKPGDKLRSLVSHLYPNAGPAYSVTVTNQLAGKLGIVFRPFLFSDTGGAGLSSLSDVVVKTKKLDEKQMNVTEMQERAEFQLQALEAFHDSQVR